MGIKVRLPNNDVIRATHTCELDLPELPATARQGHIFTNLAHPLISIPVLCDHGCTATFTNDAVTITRNGTTVLQGARDPLTAMWTLPLSSTQPATGGGTTVHAHAQANNITGLPH
jgi:hypothetical protein